MHVSLGGNINVSAMDRFYTEIRAGRAFHRGVSNPTAAGTYGEVQLLNPDGSGVTAIVRAIRVTGFLNDAVQLRRYDTALATDVGAGFNLLLGGAAAACHIRTANPAARDGTFLSCRGTLAYATFDLADDWFGELPAGTGVLVTTNLVNVDAMVHYEWIEL
jgi:hypothetical protein